MPKRLASSKYRRTAAWKRGEAKAAEGTALATEYARERLAKLESMTEGEIFRDGAHTDINRLKHQLGLDESQET